MACSEINTFAFLDLETTGLPEYSFNKVKITELAINAISSDSIFEGKCTQPRVQNKLVLCFNPKKIISYGSTEITGLDNFALEKQSTFNEKTVDLLNYFLDHQPKPVCLVAHNGNRFDYPILKDAVERLKMNFPEDLLCVDTWKMFQDLDKARQMEQNQSNEKANTPIIENPTKVEEAHQNESKENDYIIFEEIKKNSLEQMQILNEMTPVKQLCGIATLKRKQAPSEESHTKVKNVRRSLFKTVSKPQCVSFKLSDIYKYLFGREPYKSHEAESDNKSLIDIVMSDGKEFLRYAKDNAIPLSDIKSLKNNKK